jgi:hypothetical protein
MGKNNSVVRYRSNTKSLLRKGKGRNGLTEKKRLISVDKWGQWQAPGLHCVSLQRQYKITLLHHRRLGEGINLVTGSKYAGDFYSHASLEIARCISVEVFGVCAVDLIEVNCSRVLFYAGTPQWHRRLLSLNFRRRSRDKIKLLLRVVRMRILQTLGS